MAQNNKVAVFGGTGFVGYWMRKTQPRHLSLSFFGKDEYEVRDWEAVDWNYIVFLPNIAPTDVINSTIKNRLLHVYTDRPPCRILYASSGIVYHPENDTEYRQNKIKWEKECLTRGLDVVIARLFTFYGYKLDKFKAFTTFTEAARKNEPLIISGDGSTTRSYMHGRDMARIMWALLLHGARGEAYDVGDDTPVTMAELAAKIIERERSKSEIIVEGGKDPMPYYMPPDTLKTKMLLDRLEMGV